MSNKLALELRLTAIEKQYQSRQCILRLILHHITDIEYYRAIFSDILDKIEAFTMPCTNCPNSMLHIFLFHRVDASIIPYAKQNFNDTQAIQSKYTSPYMKNIFTVSTTEDIYQQNIFACKLNKIERIFGKQFLYRKSGTTHNPKHTHWDNNEVIYATDMLYGALEQNFPNINLNEYLFELKNIDYNQLKFTDIMNIISGKLDISKNINWDAVKSNPNITRETLKFCVKGVNSNGDSPEKKDIPKDVLKTDSSDKPDTAVKSEEPRTDVVVKSEEKEVESEEDDESEDDESEEDDDKLDDIKLELVKITDSIKILTTQFNEFKLFITSLIRNPDNTTIETFDK